MATAIVYCDLPSGLHLDIGDPGKPKTRVTLGNGRNEIDADLWAHWLNAHVDSSLVIDGRVREEAQPDPAPEAEAKEPTAAEKAAAVKAAVKAAAAKKAAESGEKEPT